MSDVKTYSVREEIAHSAIHGLGIALSIAGLIALVLTARRTGDAWDVVASAVYGATLILLYLASTLYHGIPHARAKRVLRVIDHSAIYLLIAGTYTPFTLISLRGPWGWTLFGLIWGLAILGIALKVAAMGRFRGLSLALYLGMGWLALVALRPLTAALARGGLILLVLGGIAYTSGVLFYVRPRLPYHHAFWHAFVLAGSVLHFFAILLYVVPGSGYSR
ncbi:MAG TPA: hemolysin III family protein [Thermoanaerobaculia bacterium]|jgi:hemolysin III